MAARTAKIPKSRIAGFGNTLTGSGLDLNQFIESLSEVAQQKDVPERAFKAPMGPASSTIGDTQKMAMYNLYWEPLLHDLQFFEGMRNNIPLISGAYSKFVDLVMQGFHLETEDPEDMDEINEMLIQDPRIDFAEIVRSSVLQLASLGNAYYVPLYGEDENGFTVRLRAIKAMAVRKLRDKDLQVDGFVQLIHRPSEFFFGLPSTPEVYEFDEICCGMAYSSDWYAYGNPPLAALPMAAKMLLQMQRDLVEMMHQHVPRIDVTYSPDPQMNEDQVEDALTKAAQMFAALKATDNYTHTPDYTIEYKGPAGKSLDFEEPLKHVSQQLFAVLPLLCAYLGDDLNINPMLATQAFRITCAMAGYIRGRIDIMFSNMFRRIEKEGYSRIKTAWTDLDAETAETVARTQEYDAQNAATNRDNGFVDQDTAAQQATHKSVTGKQKKAAKSEPLPPPIDPNKTAPTVGNPNKPPSKGGRAKQRDAAKGPKGKNRSAPTPDKRTKGRRHEKQMNDQAIELVKELEQIT